MKKLYKISLIPIASFASFAVSCCSKTNYIWNSFDEEKAFGLDIFKNTLNQKDKNSKKKMDYLFQESDKFGQNFVDWYNTLSGKSNYNWEIEVIEGKKFVKLDAAKAIFMYANINAWDTNLYLHNQKLPPNAMEYNFTDLPNTKFSGLYWVDLIKSIQLMDLAVAKGRAPFDYTCYHGVECVENELTQQLSPFIKISKSTSGGDLYDYSLCIGKTFTMYGYTSCAMNPWWCANFLYDTTKTKEEQDPSILYLPALFKIKVPHNTKCCYVSYLPLMQNLSKTNVETQTIIARNTSFLIEDVKTLDLPYTHWCEDARPKHNETSKTYKAVYFTVRVIEQS